MNEDRVLLKLQTFMNICRSLSKLSHDDKYKVATIIFTSDFREICSIGYNGDFMGGPNRRFNFEHGQSGFLHSEENALMHLSKSYELRDKLVLMCTHTPCTMCAKRIVNAGIKKVIYDKEYVDAVGETTTIFATSGIECVSLEMLTSMPSQELVRFMTMSRLR